MTCPHCCPTGEIESWVEHVRDFLDDASDADCSHSLHLRWGDGRRCPQLMTLREDWCGSCKAQDLIDRLPVVTT